MDQSKPVRPNRRARDSCCHEREEIGDPFTERGQRDLPRHPLRRPVRLYAGPVGKPIDSIHREVFAESLQDYAILQSAGIEPENPLLAEVKRYADFPKNKQRLRATMQTI